MLYPVFNSARTVIDLSGIWKFRREGSHSYEENVSTCWTSDYDTMAVPASYNDQKEDIGLRDHYGLVFYQRDIRIPGSLESQRIVLRFGSVTHQAKIYLNGVLICEHKGGFLPFEAELGQFLRPGENILTVAVDGRVDYSTLPVGIKNPGGVFKNMREAPGVPRKERSYPNFDFFNYCGIHRPVKLYTTPRSYIKDITVTASVSGGSADVACHVDTVGDGDVRIEIRDEEGLPVGCAESADSTVYIEKANLWEPLAAYLYTLEVSFGEDRYELPFGIRTVEVKGASLLINGRPFYFKGFGKHEDGPFRGKGLDEALNVKDISLMKWIGANSFRTSHYPYSEEMMRLCDREGIVVIDEVPAVGLNLNFTGGMGGDTADTFAVLQVHGHHRDVIRDLIERDKNHACVVMWSIANEPDTYTDLESAMRYFKPLYELAHEKDPQNRPVTVVSLHDKDGTDPAVLLSDVVCLNRYYGWYYYGGDLENAARALRTEMDYWAASGKPVMFTEYGADTVAGLHLSVPAMFSEEYQTEFYKANNKVLDELPFFIGEHVWCFADFATSQGITRVDGNKKGVFTRDRRPKLAAHYFKERWNAIPEYGYKKQV
jgi:beta-glucuronidase